MEILYGFLIYIFGLYMGAVAVLVFTRRGKRSTGTIFVTDENGIKTFLLELNDDPEVIENKKIVVFGVKKNAPADRE